MNKCIKCKSNNIDHVRLKMCSSCYTLKRRDDWKNNNIKRMKDPDYAKERINKQNIYIKAWKDKNKEHVNKKSLEWKSKNPHKVSKLKKIWYDKNKDKIKKKYADIHIKKYNNDKNYKLKHVLRSRLNKAINNNYKTGSAVSDLGCTIEELRKHLEDQFQEGMTWDNYGLKGWHIDHIKPLASFNLEDEEELLKACHYSNLQPLWAKDNLSKGAKYEE